MEKCESFARNRNQFKAYTKDEQNNKRYVGRKINKAKILFKNTLKYKFGYKILVNYPEMV